jgi:uroporphyrinogen-III synthase
LRVLVTRPEPDASETAARLSVLGHEAVVAPLMRVVVNESAVIPKRAYAGLLVTSGNAIRALEARDDFDRLRSLPVLAVGKRTAERARAAGFASARTAEGGAEALARLVVAETAPASGPLLYAAAEERSADLEGALRAAGFEVDLIEVYRTEGVEALAPEVMDDLREGRIGAVLLASRKTAEVFRGALGPNPPRGLRVACLAAQIAEPVADLPEVVVGVAARPDEPALFDVLASWDQARLEYEETNSGVAAMADEKTTGGEKPVVPGASRRARPPTIDAVATPVPDPAPEPAKVDVAAEAPAVEPKPEAAPAAAPSVAAEPAPEPAHQPATTPPPPAKPWMPALAGGVAGAAIVGVGALAMTLAGVGRAPDRAPEIAALTQRLAAAETQAARAGALEQALARLEPRLAAGERTGAELAALAQRVTAQAAETGGLVTTLRGEVRGLGERIAELARAPSAGDGPPAPGALATDVARLRQAFVALEQRVGVVDPGPLEARVAELAAAVTRLSEAPAAAPRADRTGALAIAAGALKAALDRGGPFQLELDAVRGLGVPAESIAGLAARAGTGVPSATALTDRFRGLARRMLDAAAPPAESTLDGIMRSAARVVSVRPTGEVQGPDPAAIVARVEARLARGDLAAALAEFRSLPEAARRAAGTFADELSARAEADALVAAITRDLLRAGSSGN